MRKCRGTVKIHQPETKSESYIPQRGKQGQANKAGA